jgi:hypothetical protein
MSLDSVTAVLRSKKGELTPVELAELLGALLGGRLDQGVIVTYFARAFPAIPLPTLLEASGWERVSSGRLSDADFNALLGAWIGTASSSTPSA